ncbi:uncharacterized protein LOC107428956 isoform X2 [Ziziphus jujuba]|nr:uncharacterized protein LOC107428956 isoform X2 [Ziziphus jujuba]
MASSLRLAKLRTAGFNVSNMLGFNGNHIAAMSSPLDKAVGGNIFLPEFDRKPVEDPNTNVEIGLPSHLYGGSMELMAVPKKKVSPHKRGIRNGPKALKPIPVIIRCKVCGRAKLPHFFCCSGDRGNTDGTLIISEALGRTA